ncbi:MAG TPA: beta-ketoacyl-[acyl-carrier-protein] synthase family protein [Candidatus Tectomicrobia bacterium]
MAQHRRVVITGLGAVAPNGIGKDAYWEGLLKGRSGIRRITRFDASEFPCQIAGEVVNFEPTTYINPHEVKRLSRVSQFALAAVKMAIDDSGMRISETNAGRVGVCFGTSAGKLEVFETDYPAFLERGIRGIHPLAHNQFHPHSVSSRVAIEIGADGVCGSVATGCTSGLDALNWGYEQICQGRAAVMVVGSAEALLSRFAFASICAAGVLSKNTMSKSNEAPEKSPKPFDLHRDGLVLSEGAGAVVLETLEHAEARQAEFYAEVMGYGTARDGSDLLRCDLSGADMARVMEIALYQAHVPLFQIDYINAHGVGLRDYDAAETAAIKTVFGKHAYDVPVSSIKSMIGQPFSAGSSLQIVASCLTLQHGRIPPTINYNTPDPACDLDYVPNCARVARVRTLLVHAHGLGGTDSALVLGKFPASRE